MVGIIYTSDCDRVNLFEYLGKSAVLAVLPLITPLHYTEKITLLNSEHVNKSSQTVTRAAGLCNISIVSSLICTIKLKLSGNLREYQNATPKKETNIKDIIDDRRYLNLYFPTFYFF